MPSVAVEGVDFYISEPSTYRIEGGLVHAEDTSGGTTIHRVTSIHNFRRSLQRANRMLAEWEASRSKPVPIKGKRAHQAAS